MVLPHGAAAPEFVDCCTKGTVIDVLVVARQLLIENAERHGDAALLFAHEDFIAVTRAGRSGPFDRLARWKHLHRARLQRCEGDATIDILGIERIASILAIGRLVRHEPGKERRNLLPDELRIVVFVEVVELDQGAGQPGLTAHLPRTAKSSQMGNLRGRDRYGLIETDGRHEGRVVRMRPMHMIGKAPADGVELDATTDNVIAGTASILVGRYIFGLEDLDLEWNRQSTRKQPRAHARKYVSALDGRADSQGLKAIKIEPALGVGLVSPFQKSRGQRLVEFRICRRKLRLDTRPDDV